MRCQYVNDISSMAIVAESRQSHAMEPKEIRRRLEETGKTQAALAKALKLDTASVNRILKGKRKIQLAEMPIIEAYLKGDVPPAKPEVSEPVEVPNPDAGPRTLDVPVLGTTLGGRESDLVILDEPIDFVRRMPGIIRKTKVYALFVQGDSMADWAQSGDLIYVDPTVPPRIGDYVVIQMKEHPEGGTRAFVKRLLARTPTKLRVLQLNPRKEIEFPAEHVDKVHKVLSLKELSGI